MWVVCSKHILNNGNCSIQKEINLNVTIDLQWSVYCFSYWSKTRKGGGCDGSFQFTFFFCSRSCSGERIIDGAHERNDPLKILMMYIENEGLRVWDMFTQLDKDGDMKLSPDEVKSGLQVRQQISEEASDSLQL